MQFLTTRMRVVDQLAFAADGRRLFAAGSTVPDLRYKPDNRGIDVFDLAGPPGPAEHWLPTDLIGGFVVNPAGRWLYVGTGHKPLEPGPEGYWAVDLTSSSPTRLGPTRGAYFVLAVHPSGEWLVGSVIPDGRGGPVLVRWRQPADEPPVVEWEGKTRSAHSYPYHIACAPDGSAVITQDIEGGRAVTEQVYELLDRDPASGKVVGKTPIPGRTVHQLLFSPDGAHLVVRAGPSFLVWNGCDSTEKPRKIKGAIRTNLTGLAFHPSGRYLAATGNDRTVQLYDTATWQVARTFQWDIGLMRSVAFRPDGEVAAAGSDTGKIVLWDTDL